MKKKNRQPNLKKYDLNDWLDWKIARQLVLNVKSGLLAQGFLGHFGFDSNWVSWIGLSYHGSSMIRCMFTRFQLLMMFGTSIWTLRVRLLYIWFGRVGCKQMLRQCLARVLVARQVFGTPFGLSQPCGTPNIVPKVVVSTSLM